MEFPKTAIDILQNIDSLQNIDILASLPKISFLLLKNPELCVKILWWFRNGILQFDVPTESTPNHVLLLHFPPAPPVPPAVG